MQRVSEMKEGEIKAYSRSCSWRQIIVQNVAHVLNLAVTRGSEHVRWEVTLQGRENFRREIQFQVIVGFWLVILVRILHQSSFRFVSVRIPCRNIVSATAITVLGRRRHRYPPVTGAITKRLVSCPIFGSVNVFLQREGTIWEIRNFRGGGGEGELGFLFYHLGF